MILGTITVLSGVLAMILFSFSLAIIFQSFSEKDNNNNIKSRMNTIGYLGLLLSFLLVALAILSFNEWDNENRRKSLERETNATYYLVTEATKKEIIDFCEDKHPKLSTQNTCKRTTERMLKRGKEYNGFKPSDVITKPSGVVPQ